MSMPLPPLFMPCRFAAGLSIWNFSSIAPMLLANTSVPVIPRLVSVGVMVRSGVLPRPCALVLYLYMLSSPLGLCA
jgi:hypothetical protein